LRISIVSTNRHNVVEWEFFCADKLNRAGAKPEVVSNLEINSIAEKFRRISPIILDIYVAGIIAEHPIHNGACEIQNGGKSRK
jgi:hypothetical protein